MKTIIRVTAFLISMGTTIPAVSLAQWVQSNGPYGRSVRCFAVSAYGGGTNLFAGISGAGVWTRARCQAEYICPALLPATLMRSEK